MKLEKIIRASFRTVQLILAGMIGGVISYSITKYYETFDLYYFKFLVIALVIFGIIIFLLHYFFPDEVQ